ncbi:hypothetical protein N431DRAFT_539968 [Stipitochalara longipes BDJ]|nr:hypothetical protein N431DRAFT_539968 [Stipitochalara longipes BDJ]
MGTAYCSEQTQCLSLASSDATSCYSEDSQPRICFDDYCTFPMGNICQACKLDRAVRKKRVSRSEKVRLIEEWVGEINVQKYIMNYSGQEFVGGADDQDVLEEEYRQEESVKPLIDEEDQSYDADEGDDECSSNETELPNDLDESNRPDFSDLIPVSFTSQWTTHPNPSSTEVASRPSACFDKDTHLESWISDIFDRTLDGQMEDTIFIGSAEDNPSQVLCPLCRNPVGDPRDQHSIQCQFAHDEQERMEASLRNHRTAY